MLRTTNKKVVQELRQHVLDNFLPENYDTQKPENTPVQNLRDQLNYMKIYNQSIYRTALDYVEGGGYLIYHGEVRDYLKNLLEQTDEYAEQFSDDKVWRLYCHLIARTMTDIYVKGIK